MPFSTGYNMEYEFKFSDGLGKLYMAIATIWSLILISGSVFLIRNHQLPFLSIRNVPLAVSAVAILHVYWILCFVAYGLNGFFPCATEFWIMNIYLPLGIALFHLSNTKLLQVAVLQRKYANPNWLTQEKNTPLAPVRGFTKYAVKYEKYGTYEKAKHLIGIGIMIQLVCALFIFMVSRKFHGSYGLIGTSMVNTAANRAACRRGWEWMLSIAWQFLWSWIYAPYLLWKVRGIRDTHGWRTQTFVCCLAGLPASPMWLTGLYLPPMSTVNRYFIPPMWFVPSILLIEAFTILQPCWQVFKHYRMKKETLDIIAQWERQKNGSSFESNSTNTTQSPKRISHRSPVLGSASSRKSHPHMYTMAALDKALQTNSTPLLLFAALKDFSGENISFLNHVSEWRKVWDDQRSSPLRNAQNDDDSSLRYNQFVRAIEIYSSFVSMKYSAFPINISHSHLKELQMVFEESASIVNTDPASPQNSATPFDDFAIQMDDIESARGQADFSVASTAIELASNSTDENAISASKQSTVINVYKAKMLGDKVPPSLPIPVSFKTDVFDNAADSIKYMVLTNTWPKFVDAGYAANFEKSTTMTRFQDRLSVYGIGRSRIWSL